MTFCEFLEWRLDTKKWCVKQRLTDKLRRRGYEIAVSQEKFTELKNEYEALTS